MPRLVIIFTFYFSCTVNFSWGMQPAPTPQQVVLSHKKRSVQDLIHPIPKSLSSKSLVHLNALLEQEDHFSCVYRSLFHAQCLSLASQEVIQRKATFTKSLEKMFLDENLLKITFNFLKNYIDQHHPTHDKTKGVCLNQLLGVCAAHIPLLHTQLLPIYLDDDNQTIYALHDPTLALPSPLHYSADFIRNYGTAPFSYDVCKKELDQSTELAHQLKKLEKSNNLAHFACMYTVQKGKKWHLFLATIITNKHGKAKLYIIDSNNNDLANSDQIRILSLKILTYVKTHNAQRKAKKAKTPPII